MIFKRSKVTEEIPTSSMADIAFLLIIYFMVTMTFTATRGLDFALPEEDDTPPVIEKEDSVLIEIQPDGQYLVDQKAMRLDEIFDYLKPKLEANPKKPVILRPQPTSSYGYMVAAFDTLRHIKVKTDDSGAREAYQVTSAQIQEAEELETDLGTDVNVSIPTQREIDAFWF
jgi:biopolymer transport protein ExbD